MTAQKYMDRFLLCCKEACILSMAGKIQKKGQNCKKALWQQVDLSPENQILSKPLFFGSSNA